MARKNEDTNCPIRLHIYTKWKADMDYPIYNILSIEEVICYNQI